MALEDAVDEVWAYAGKHMDSKQRLRDVWYDPKDDQERVYTNLRADVIGGLYNLRVDRSNGRLTIYGKPDWRGDRMDDHTKMTEFIVRDMSQRNAHARFRAAKNETDPFDEAIKPLLQYARSCTTSQQRAALCAAVIEKLYRPWLT